VLYNLAGMASPTAGWEPEFESQVVHKMLKALGGPDQTVLGDKGLATALLRTQGLAAERRLTEITLDFCRSLGVAARILPMTDDAVRTNVLTADGVVTFQEFFTTLACEPKVHGFQYAGADEARISDEVMDALHSADLEAVVVCPSNPYHVIRPILEVNGMKELLLKGGAPVIAVTPIVGGKALRGSAGKIMRDLGREPSARAVATEYLRFIDGFVIDREDIAYAEGVRSLGIEVVAVNTIMRTDADRIALAAATLEFAGAIRQKWAEEVQ